MWSNWSWTDNIKKRVCRYLLQRYLGQYLQEKISLDQLSVDVFNGTGNVSDVTLDISALNSVVEQQNLPIEFVDGRLGNVSVSIPWSSIMQESCEIEISNMCLTIQPKGRHDNGASMLDSMWTSMASSMQLAEECLKATDNEDNKDITDENTTPLAGLEHCAQTIDAILARVKMCFNNTVVRIILGGENQDLGCEFHIRMCKYSGTNSDEVQNEHDSPFYEKKILMEGVSCFIGGDIRDLGDHVSNDVPPLIQIGRFDGRQILKIKIKKDNNIRGPQVFVDCGLGAFYGFLSPFQIHVLTKVVDELLDPFYNNKASPSRKLAEKPMDTFDFKRVEDELQEQLKPSGIGISGIQKQLQYGWSFPPQDEADDQFLPFETSKTNFGSTSVTSSVMESSAISVSSIESTSATESLFCSSSTSVLLEPADIGNSEKLKFSISCISASLVILEKEVVKFYSPSKAADGEFFEKLEDLSRTFFAKLGPGFSFAEKRDLDSVCKRLHSYCRPDHIVLMATPIKLEGAKSLQASAMMTTGHLSLGSFQLSEFLEGSASDGLVKTEGEYVQFLRFPDLDRSIEAIRIDFTNRSNSIQSSKTNLRFSIQPCHLEFDMSILDRIMDIILPPLNLYGSSNLDSEIHHRLVHSMTGILLKFPKILVNIRFPVPDLSSDGTSTRFKRNLRPDSLQLVMQNVVVSTLFDSRIKNIVVETKCKEAEMFYEATQSANPVSVAVASAYDDQVEGMSMRSQGYDWPRVLFSFSSEPKQELLQDKRQEEDESLGGFNLGAKEPSPFSAQRVVHEGQIKVENKKGDQTMPGDASEINKFIEATCATSKFNIQVDLRCVKINLESKNLFELIYNRICVDLLLWEPAILALDTDSSDRKYDESKSQIFRSCQPSTEFGEMDDETQQTTFIPGSKRHMRWKDPMREGINEGSSKICLNISISEGTCSIATELEADAGSENGLLSFTVKNATLFIVSGYKGCQEAGFVCAVVKQIELFHKDSGENKLQRTIYPSDESVQATFQTNENTAEMLSLAIKINRDITTNIKTFKVAMSIKKGTLHHVVSSMGSSWLGQLIEFFDVVDVPVSGYTPASVIVEFHLHLLECSVDYRPLYLPLRSIVTFERLAISSNIAAQARQSVLQIMVEDAALFLTNKPDSTCILEDYVCVMELDVLEILLRMSQNINQPAVDLTLSNNKLHIRTCSDTYKATVDLFSYFACDGDLRPLDKDEPDDLSALVSKRTPGIPNPEGIEFGPDICTEELVAEAMFETTHNDTDTNECLTQSYTTPLREPFANYDDPVMEVFGGDPLDIHPSDDEDFCILENDPGVGIISKSGEPTSRSLVDEPITLVENHFSLPAGRFDILRAPKHYPKPILKYTIQDITIIWDVYAGQDFCHAGRRNSDLDEYSVGCDIGTDALECGVLFSKPKAFESAWLEYQQPVKPKTRNNWRINGGGGRRKDICVELLLSKVKFQYDVYPASSEVCSRQVLVINTVEVKDKLASSQFNKMLYLHTSSSQPKQSHANMIVIKLVQTKTNPQLNIDECCLKISILPIRLNIDQDALIFLHKFYSDSIDQTLQGACQDQENQNPDAELKSSPLENASVGPSYRNSVNNSFLSKDSSCDSDSSTNESRCLYFRKVVLNRDIPIKLDYHGKRMDLSHGPLAGVLMGLAQLNNSEIRLKRINYPHGILGVDKLMKFIISEWTQDITKNQLPSLLGGVGPMHSFVQLFQGVRDLFWMPIEQYNKDGRIAKGFQRGANSFSTSTATAMLEITNKMVRLIQGAAEFTYDMVSPSPGLYRNSHQVKGRKRRHAQPGDIRQGMSNAFQVVRDGLGDTAKTIVHVASKEHEQKGVSGAVGGVLRQLPPTVVHPIILVAEATSNVLDGFRSHLEPEFKKQEEEKWKDNT